MGSRSHNYKELGAAVRAVLKDSNATVVTEVWQVTNHSMVPSAFRCFSEVFRLEENVHVPTPSIRQAACEWR